MLSSRNCTRSRFMPAVPCAASRPRSPKSRGLLHGLVLDGRRLPGQGIFGGIVQAANSFGVEALLVDFEDGSQERPFRQYLDRVADRLRRGREPHVGGAGRAEFSSAGEQLGGGGVIESAHCLLQRKRSGR